MPHTDGRWTNGTSFPGLQQFIGADEFALLGGTAPLPATIVTPGLLFRTVAAGSAAIFAKSLSELLLRALLYASSAYDQEQFGTAASVPGPSTVAGTSGPLAIPGSGSPNYQGFPPIPAANLATLAGPSTTLNAKGIQIDSVDVIYQVLTDATAVAATIGLTKTVFANLVAPVVTNLIALGNNGLPVVIGAQPQVKNVAVTAPAMIAASDTDVLLNINLTGGTAGTIKFYGAVINSHYNFS
jgi:hypothetical protein